MLFSGTYRHTRGSFTSHKSQAMIFGVKAAHRQSFSLGPVNVFSFHMTLLAFWEDPFPVRVPEMVRWRHQFCLSRCPAFLSDYR
jgi:hypothetical protein